MSFHFPYIFNRYYKLQDKAREERVQFIFMISSTDDDPFEHQPASSIEKGHTVNSKAQLLYRVDTAAVLAGDDAD